MPKRGSPSFREWRGKALTACLLAFASSSSAQETSFIEAAYARWESVLADLHSGKIKRPEAPPAEKAPDESHVLPASEVTPIIPIPTDLVIPQLQLPPPGGGAAIIDGRVIRTRPRAAPNLFGETVSTASRVAPASSAVSLPAATATLAPTATPAPVKIKVARLVEGKIVMVEIEVTPTPAPTQVAPATPTAAAPAQVKAATGVMAELQERLAVAVKSPEKPTEFQPRQLAKMREEISRIAANLKKEKKPPEAAAGPVASLTQVTQLLVKIHRLSAQAKGASLDAPTAKAIQSLLFPEPPKPQAKAASPQVAGATMQSATRSASASPATSGGDDLFIVEEEEPQASTQREIFIDPVTGQYVYEDGTPVSPPQQQQPNPYSPPPPPPQEQPPPVEYSQPPPPPPPPPEYYVEEGTIGGETGADPGYYEDQGYVEENPDEMEYEEDPSFQEEPEVWEEGEFQEGEGEYYEEDYTEFDENEVDPDSFEENFEFE
ncbi:MAG: hypothetical protein HUU16_14550 [Candidatus Omnitrophica bacterium]|nr:hypothetical protein [bacterium]NUN97381.1 hypothetical protein [Candidatus Omnitrophota bacterium]